MRELWTVFSICYTGFMEKALAERIERARVILETARHAAIATVNEDGTPHNTPLVFIRDDKLDYIYWGSHPESLHSKNAIRTGNVFMVVYDMIKRGGLYIQAMNAHELSGAELVKALKIRNDMFVAQGGEPIQLAYYQGNSPQRMYAAKTAHVWVNVAERDAQGDVLKDSRVEISRSDLLVHS